MVSRTTRGEDGEAITETTHGPGYKDVLKAIDVTNKMDGQYAKAQGAVDVAVTEYRELSKRFFGPGAKISATLRAKRVADTPTDSPVAHVEALPSDAQATVGPAVPPESAEGPRDAPAPTGDGGGGHTAPRSDCVSLSPNGAENFNKGE